MTYAFTHEKISPPPHSPSSGWDLGIWAEILALGMGFWASGLDFDLEARIWALKTEKEKLSHV